LTTAVEVHQGSQNGGAAVWSETSGYLFGGYPLTPAETNSFFKVAAASNAAFVKGFAAGENLIQIDYCAAFGLWE
jgi:hypothetical protein